jgi:DNA-binding MarR family transcriptional regulator
MSRQDSLGFLLADLARLMRRAFAQHLAGSSLTLTQARALLNLERQAGLRQVELAALLEIQPITLARLIDQLEQGGLVTRAPDPADRRAYRLYLTEQAKPHLEAIAQVIAVLDAEILRDMNSQQAANLQASLRAMRDNLASLSGPPSEENID